MNNRGIVKFLKPILFLSVLSFSPVAISQNETLERFDRAHHGYYSEDRTQFHLALVEKFLSGLTASGGKPEITVLAGPMAAGKSMLAKRLLKNDGSTVHIDIDAIRKLLPEFSKINQIDRINAVYETQKESGYIAELLLWEAMDRGLNVVFESSFRETDFFKNLKIKIQTLAPKYKDSFNLAFVFADIESLKIRAKERDQHDSRYTPEHDVIDRYSVSMVNFFRIKSVFNFVTAIDLSPNVQRIVYVEKNFGQDQQAQGTSLPLSQISNFSSGTVYNAAIQRPQNKGYDLFIDIDWTTFYPIYDPNTCEPDKLIRYDGKNGPEYYRMVDHADTLIERMLALKNMRIHFMTGADADRARFLLSYIKIKNGRYKGHSALSKATTVTSINDLLPLSEDTDLPFTQRFGKYVQKIRPTIDMTRAGLLDDNLNFPRFGIPVIDSYGIYFFRKEFDSAAIGKKFEAPTLEEHRKERNRLLTVADVIEKAFVEDLNGTSRFSDLVVKTPWSRKQQKSVLSCQGFYQKH